MRVLASNANMSLTKKKLFLYLSFEENVEISANVELCYLSCFFVHDKYNFALIKTSRPWSLTHKLLRYLSTNQVRDVMMKSGEKQMLRKMKTERKRKGDEDEARELERKRAVGR